MAELKTLLFLVCCSLAISAFPQGVSTTDNDVETITTQSTGDLPAGDDDVPIIFIRRIPIFFGSSGDGPLFPSLFPSLFNRFLPDFSGNSTSNTTSTTRRFPKFPPFFLGGGDAFEGDLNMNSTHEVTMKNGHKVEVNRTTGTNKDGDVVFTRVVMNILPDEGAEGKNATDGANASPFEDPFVNQEVTSPPLVRRKRWSLRDYLNSMRRRKVKAKSLPKCHVSDESAENLLADRPSVLNVPPLSLRLPNPPPSLEGDTDVNYIGPITRDNPDAEIIDVELVRADAEKFRSRNSSPVRPGPMRSQPIMAGPMRSQPIMAEPLRSLRSHPAMDEPLRSLRAQPVEAEPLRSQPFMAEPLRSLRSQPAVDEPLRSQPIMVKTLRSLRLQPVMAEPSRSLRSQPVLAKPLESKPDVTEPLKKFLRLL